jgi:DNA-binding NarL/FixJ family response regulator
MRGNEGIGLAGRETTSEDTVPLRLVLATSRPLLAFLFQQLAQRDRCSVDVVVPATDRLEECDEQLTAASAAVVDISDAVSSVAFCSELHRRHPLLPIVVLFCCPQASDPSQLKTLLRLGALSVFDLQATPEEVMRTLETAVRGGSTLHLHLLPGNDRFLHDLVALDEPRSATKVAILELVSLGLPEREIGRRLYLSPHTVKHHIEDLRHELCLRNRIELAAWAGRHGFYRPERTGRPERRSDFVSGTNVA